MPHEQAKNQRLRELPSELPEWRRRAWVRAPSLWPQPPSSGASTAATPSAAVGTHKAVSLPQGAGSTPLPCPSLLPQVRFPTPHSEGM